IFPVEVRRVEGCLPSPATARPYSSLFVARRIPPSAKGPERIRKEEPRSGRANRRFRCVREQVGSCSPFSLRNPAPGSTKAAVTDAEWVPGGDLRNRMLHHLAGRGALGLQTRNRTCSGKSPRLADTPFPMPIEGGFAGTALVRN